MTGTIPVRTAKLLAAALGAIAIFSLAASAAGAMSVAYNNFPKPIPGNVQSQAFQATSAAEFGGQVGFAGGVTNPKITVGMSSWACQSGSATDGTCVSHTGRDVQRADHAERV